MNAELEAVAANLLIGKVGTVKWGTGFKQFFLQKWNGLTLRMFSSVKSCFIRSENERGE